MASEPVLDEEVLEVLPHQTRMLCAPWWYPDRDYFLSICGYNAGKSTTLILQAYDLIERYQGKYIKIGIGGPTIVKLEETTVFELKKFFLLHGVSYKTNGKTNTITCGTVVLQLIGMQQAETIYAHRFQAFLGDELDELKFQEVIDADKAIQERTREPFPDGREAFVCYYTTAQGFRGTYSLVEQLKSIKQPYYLIHARSRDNKFISQHWLERMERIYNEVERKVFLDGEFANLLTGRVYYGYDEERNRFKIAPFQPQPSDYVKIGQDLNSGFSRGCAIIKRMWLNRKTKTIMPTLFIVKAWSFNQIGHAPQIIRSDFPTQEIDWYPDATGKEIIKGYIAEVNQQDIHVKFAAINPNRVDRIFVVNKMLENEQLMLFPGEDVTPVAMALKTRQYEENGEPMKRQGENDPSHYCDSVEYDVFRIIAWDPDFKDYLLATRSGRYEEQKKTRQMGGKNLELHREEVSSKAAIVKEAKRAHTLQKAASRAVWDPRRRSSGNRRTH